MSSFVQEIGADLFALARAGHVGAFALAIKEGADWTVLDRRGRSPFDLLSRTLDLWGIAKAIEIRLREEFQVPKEVSLENLKNSTLVFSGADGKVGVPGSDLLVKALVGGRLRFENGRLIIYKEPVPTNHEELD